MSKRSEKRARMAAANARLDRHATSTNYIQTGRACAAKGLTLLGNFERGPARQQLEADMRTATKLANRVQAELPAPGDVEAYDALVALVAAR